MKKRGFFVKSLSIFEIWILVMLSISVAFIIKESEIVGASDSGASVAFRTAIAQAEKKYREAIAVANADYDKVAASDFDGSALFALNGAEDKALATLKDDLTIANNNYKKATATTAVSSAGSSSVGTSSPVGSSPRLGSTEARGSAGDTLVAPPVATAPTGASGLIPVESPKPGESDSDTGLIATKPPKPEDSEAATAGQFGLFKLPDTPGGHLLASVAYAATAYGALEFVTNMFGLKDEQKKSVQYGVSSGVGVYQLFQAIQSKKGYTGIFSKAGTIGKYAPHISIGLAIAVFVA